MLLKADPVYIIMGRIMIRIEAMNEFGNKEKKISWTRVCLP